MMKEGQVRIPAGCAIAAVISKEGKKMTGKQRAVLRKMANTIETIIYVGKDGITEHIVKEVYEVGNHVLDQNGNQDQIELAVKGPAADVFFKAHGRHPPRNGLRQYSLCL